MKIRNEAVALKNSSFDKLADPSLGTAEPRWETSPLGLRAKLIAPMVCIVKESVQPILGPATVTALET
jgi:hypothetical protein